MTYRKPFRLLVAFLLLIAVSAAYAVYWHHVATRLEDGIAVWAEGERAAGRDVQFAPGSITGFPFAFRREFHDVTLHQQQLDGTLTLTARDIVAVIRPWNLQVIALATSEPITAALRMFDTRDMSLTTKAGAGEIQLLADGRLQALDLQAREIEYADGVQRYVATSGQLTLDLPPLTPRDHRQPLLTVGIELADLRLPDGQRALTAEPIAKAGLTGTIMGPVQSGLPLKDALAAWARGGGTVELSRFSFAQTPLDLEGEGTLALGNDLQLLGALTIRAVGLPETIDLLAADGVIDTKAAKTGRLMADGLAKPDEQGRRVVRVSLSLQQGYVWLGPIRLTRLPRLVW